MLTPPTKSVTAAVLASFSMVLASGGPATADRLTVQDPPESQSDYSDIVSATFFNGSSIIRGHAEIPGLHQNFGAHSTLTIRAGMKRHPAEPVVWTLSHLPYDRTRLYRQGPRQTSRHQQQCRGMQTVKVVNERSRDSYMQMSVPHKCIPGSRWASFSFRFIVFDDDTHADAIPGAQDGSDVPSGPPTGPFTRWVRRG